ncbi:MAG: alpha,6-mannosyltransferase [bacterium]|jgi:alpha-1,6-mannosyltransferase
MAVPVHGPADHAASLPRLPHAVRRAGVGAGSIGPTIGAVALVGAVLTSLTLAAGGSSRRLLFFVPASLSGFPGWMRGPLSGLDLGLGPSTASLLLIVLCAGYGLALANARHVGLRYALGAVGCAQLAFMLAAPLYSADIFGYLDYARLAVLHGVDPYVHGAAAAPHDAVRRYVRWRDTATPYGPVFTIATYPLAWLGVPAAFWTLKVFACAASLGVVALVARIARQLARPVVPAVLFVGLNPVLLAYGVGGGHNDFFAVLVALAGVTLALDGHERGASAGFVIAAAVKAPAGIALAFLLIAQRSRRAMFAAVAAAAGVALTASLAFDSAGLGLVGQFVGQQRLVARLSVPNLVARGLGLDGVTPIVRVVATAILVAGVAALLWRVWHGADWLAASGWATLLVLLTSAWLVPWYVIWLLPIAAVAGDARLRAAALAFTAFVVITHVAAYVV